MAYSRQTNTPTYPLKGFDSNTFLNPLPLHTTGEGNQSVPFLQHSLLTFFSEFDAIVTRELRLPATKGQH